jgi:hypothetical protein
VEVGREAGAVFTVRLPLAGADAEPEPEAEPEEVR